MNSDLSYSFGLVIDFFCSCFWAEKSTGVGLDVLRISNQVFLIEVRIVIS